MLSEKLNFLPSRLCRERADLALISYFAAVRLFIIKEIVDYADCTKLSDNFSLALLILFDPRYASNIICIDHGERIFLFAWRETSIECNY